MTKTGVKQIPGPEVGLSGLIQHASRAENSAEWAMRAEAAGSIFREWVRMLRARQESGETLGGLKPGPLQAGRVLLFRTGRGLADGLIEAKRWADAKAGAQAQARPKVKSESQS